ncbi:MAG: hypothetical protein MZV65_18935 [Chromatiales bacterium]|nr:hypothetical protein [Chromatiales bacterium]
MPLLAQAFLDQLAADIDKARCTPDAPDALEVLAATAGRATSANCATPSSARAVLPYGTIEVRDLPHAILHRRAPAPTRCSSRWAAPISTAGLKGVERRAILQALEPARAGQAACRPRRRAGSAFPSASLWHRIKELKIQVNKPYA